MRLCLPRDGLVSFDGSDEVVSLFGDREAVEIVELAHTDLIGRRGVICRVAIRDLGELAFSAGHRRHG